MDEKRFFLDGTDGYLYILENVWGWFFRQLYANGQQYHNVGQLTIQCAWNTITQGYLDSLFNSIPNRIFEVIHKGESHIHY
jgi:hypothetical protein